MNLKIKKPISLKIITAYIFVALFLVILIDVFSLVFLNDFSSEVMKGLKLGFLDIFMPNSTRYTNFEAGRIIGSSLIQAILLAFSLATIRRKKLLGFRILTGFLTVIALSAGLSGILWTIIFALTFTKGTKAYFNSTASESQTAIDDFTKQKTAVQE